MADNGWAENNKGWNLLNGIGCVKDEAEAIRWFELSAAKGCGTAMVNLGDTLAYANLGYCYETGQGVPADKDKAREYYEKGAALGEENCMEMLKKLQL